MEIEKVIKEFEKTLKRQSKLSFLISEHYQPIINKAVKNKDRDKLHSLLDVLPSCTAKLGVYHGLRIIKDK